MIDILEKSKCSGCSACANACNHNAISMKSDELGFFYPIVNPDLCVACGLCDSICQFRENYNRYDNYDLPKAYLFRLYDDEELKNSQSGGAFFAISSAFIKKGGVVYGAAFDGMFRVTHVKADNLDELRKIRMTKYVQSNMEDVYRQVKNDLKIKRVLFSGTPCQVAGIKSFIPEKLHTNLFCIDVICHGVPSPGIWAAYLDYISKKYKSQITRVRSRDKRFGWHGATESYLFDNGREVFRKTYNRLYFDGYIMRESCAQCPFANTNRIGDITLGDLWGLPKDSPYEDDKGVSLVLINSEKGFFLKSLISSKDEMKELDMAKFLQPQLSSPSKLNAQYHIFQKDYTTHGLTYVLNKYGDTGLKYKLRLLKTNIIETFSLWKLLY